jgi:hypothetical protein
MRDRTLVLLVPFVNRTPVERDKAAKALGPGGRRHVAERRPFDDAAADAQRPSLTLAEDLRSRPFAGVGRLEEVHPDVVAWEERARQPARLVQQLAAHAVHHRHAVHDGAHAAGERLDQYETAARQLRREHARRPVAE